MSGRKVSASAKLEANARYGRGLAEPATSAPYVGERVETHPASGGGLVTMDLCSAYPVPLTRESIRRTLRSDFDLLRQACTDYELRAFKLGRGRVVVPPLASWLERAEQSARAAMREEHRETDETYPHPPAVVARYLVLRKVARPESVSTALEWANRADWVLLASAIGEALSEADGMPDLSASVAIHDRAFASEEWADSFNMDTSREAVAKRRRLAALDAEADE